MTAEQITPTSAETVEAVGPMAVPLCKEICDLLGEPRILVADEVLALLCRPAVTAALAPALAAAEQRGAERALREARTQLRAERAADPSTYNVWTRVTNALDRADRIAGQP